MTIQVADEVLGRFARQQHDWFERVRKGSLDPEEVTRAIHRIIDTSLVSAHLTTREQLEEQIAKDPGDLEFWLHPKQVGEGPRPTGYDVYATLRKTGLLERSLSLGELKFLQRHPGRLPTTFFMHCSSRLYSWKAISKSPSGGDSQVAHLYWVYPHRKLIISWSDLSAGRAEVDFTGLRRTT